MEAIGRVIESLAASTKKEHIELFKKLSTGINFDNIKTPEEFGLLVILEFDSFKKGLIVEKFGDSNDIMFLLMNYFFIEHHINKLFEEIEGAFACADKTRTITNALLKFYQEGTKIHFNYEGEYTFHLPKKILNEHGEIISYYKALKSLFYGNTQPYFKHLLEYKYYQ